MFGAAIPAKLEHTLLRIAANRLDASITELFNPRQGAHAVGTAWKNPR